MILKKSEKQNPDLNQVCFGVSFSVFFLFFYIFKFRYLLVWTEITLSFCCLSWLITSASQPQKTHCLLEVGTGPEWCCPPYCALKPWSCSSFWLHARGKFTCHTPHCSGLGAVARAQQKAFPLKEQLLKPTGDKIKMRKSPGVFNAVWLQGCVKRKDP